MKSRLAVALAATYVVFSPGAQGTDTKFKTTTKAPPPSLAAPVTQLPSAKTKVRESALQRGEKVFKRAMCIGCHSDGNNSLVPDRPIKGKAFLARYKQDKALENTIRKGFPDSGMEGYGKDQINDSEIKDLILYIRTFSSKGS